jgi:small subunit ribosomal protein S1
MYLCSPNSIGKRRKFILAKKQEAEKELKAKEAELGTVSATKEKENIESEADSLSIEEIKSNIATSREDFDWDADDKKFGNYSDADREKLEKMYDGTFNSINKGEIITGTVVISI